jgi:hypothetical protein
MRSHQNRTRTSLLASQTFIEENKDAMSGVLQTGAKKNLDASNAAMDSHLADQAGNASAAKSATQKTASLITTLVRDHMRPIARIATADLPQVPELSPLRFRRGAPNTGQLIAAALGVAQAAVPYADTFIAEGLPVDFIAQLETAIAAVNDSITLYKQSRS